MTEYINNNSFKLKNQSFFKSEPNLVFNLDYNKQTSNNKENCAQVLDYKDYINQQRELLEKIYHQQKKLKQFHFETDYLTGNNSSNNTKEIVNYKNNINNVNDSFDNHFSSSTNPKIIYPQSKNCKNNIYSANNNIKDNQNEVLLNKQNIMSISLNNHNHKNHFQMSKTCKKPLSSISPSNDSLSTNLQLQQKSSLFLLNKCKPNDSVNINSCCKTKTNSQSELLKTQVKKETLETEIQLLENKLKLKRKELRNSTNSLNNGLCCSNSNESIVVGVGASSGVECVLPNRLNYSLDDSNSSTLINHNCRDKKLKLSRHNSSNFINSDLSKPLLFSNIEPSRLINMTDKEILKSSSSARHHQNSVSCYIEKANRKIEKLEAQLNKTKEELIKEQKSNRERDLNLEEELKQTRLKLDQIIHERDCLIHDLNTRERESFNNVALQNTEKHLTSLCQTLTNELEDVRLQLKLSDEKCKRLEFEQNDKNEKISLCMNQIESLKKEVKQGDDSYHQAKRSYEEKLNIYLNKEKDLSEINSRILKEREDEILDLKSQLAESKNIKLNNQQLNDALIQDYKKTITKQNEEIISLEELIKYKTSQFELYQRELETAMSHKIEERIKNEKTLWEQEQNFLIRKEISKISDEKSKEIISIQEDLNSEKEKLAFEKNRSVKYEEELNELQQELKQANKEKINALAKAKELLKCEFEKIKIEAYNEKKDEINKYKKVINNLENEIESYKLEQQQNIEKERNLFANMENLEKNFIKEINDEQRKLSPLIPGFVPKLINYASIKNSIKNNDNIFNLNALQIAFSNLRNLLEELSVNYQNMKSDHENTKRMIIKINQEKEESIEEVKRQYERQKQKELETIRDYVSKDQDTMNNYTNEVGSLVAALKNKDQEIKEIQQNMTEWKKETLTKLAQKFEIELNKELDKRMKDYKSESIKQQSQLDKIKAEMDGLIKDYKQNNNQLISQNTTQDQQERMIKYLQARLNDLRDENLSLRERIKTSNAIPHHQINQITSSKTYSGLETFENNYDDQLTYTGESIEGSHIKLTGMSIGSTTLRCDSVSDDENIKLFPIEDNLESKNELLQQKLDELQKLQMQLSNF